jgi:hypothetical protein
MVPVRPSLLRSQPKGPASLLPRAVALSKHIGYFAYELAKTVYLAVVLSHSYSGLFTLHRILLATGLLVAAGPLVSFAQTTATTLRFYAGAGVSLLTDAPFVKSGSSTILGPSLTGGVRLSPRWAV